MVSYRARQTEAKNKKKQKKSNKKKKALLCNINNNKVKRCHNHVLQCYYLDIYNGIIVILAHSASWPMSFIGNSLDYLTCFKFQLYSFFTSLWMGLTQIDLWSTDHDFLFKRDQVRKPDASFFHFSLPKKKIHGKQWISWSTYWVFKGSSCDRG